MGIDRCRPGSRVAAYYSKYVWQEELALSSLASRIMLCSGFTTFFLSFGVGKLRAVFVLAGCTLVSSFPTLGCGPLIPCGSLGATFLSGLYYRALI